MVKFVIKLDPSQFGNEPIEIELNSEGGSKNLKEEKEEVSNDELTGDVVDKFVDETLNHKKLLLDSEYDFRNLKPKYKLVSQDYVNNKSGLDSLEVVDNSSRVRQPKNPYGEYRTMLEEYPLFKDLPIDVKNDILPKLEILNNARSIPTERLYKHEIEYTKNNIVYQKQYEDYVRQLGINSVFNKFIRPETNKDVLVVSLNNMGIKNVEELSNIIKEGEKFIDKASKIHFDISHNELVTVKDLVFPANTMSVNFSHNKITHFETPLLSTNSKNGSMYPNMYRIKSINLSNNCISDLRNIDVMRNNAVEYLNLSGNSFNEIPEYTTFSSSIKGLYLGEPEPRETPLVIPKEFLDKLKSDLDFISLPQTKEPLEIFKRLNNRSVRYVSMYMEGDISPYKLVSHYIEKNMFMNEIRRLHLVFENEEEFKKERQLSIDTTKVIFKVDTCIIETENQRQQRKQDQENNKFIYFSSRPEKTTFNPPVLTR